MPPFSPKTAVQLGPNDFLVIAPLEVEAYNETSDEPHLITLLPGILYTVLDAGDDWLIGCTRDELPEIFELSLGKPQQPTGNQLAQLKQALLGQPDD